MTQKMHYNIIRIRRFLLQTALIFVFQFLIIINLNFTYPPVSMYPPIGLAFTFFYLLGNNAFFGLLLAGSSAYFLKGLPLDTLVLYLTADILGGYIGAALSLRVLSSDIRPFVHWQECLAFFKINALTACLFSSALRLFPMILHYNNNMTSFHLPARVLDSDFLGAIFFNFLDLWLADINGILILSSFIFSWAYISFSRERITPYGLSYFVPIGFLGFILLSVLFMASPHFSIVILIAMIATLISSLLYGYLIATALLFVVSSIYFTFFMAQLPQFVHYFGLGLYTVIPTLLLLFTLGVLYLGHRKLVR